MAVSATSTLAITLSRSNQSGLVSAREQAGLASSDSNGSKAQSASSRQLNQAQQRQVDELRESDRKVRQHAEAHVAAGSGVIRSGPQYSYTYGPDGRQYATSGDVAFDTSREQKPEANIDKGQRLQTAALAPSQPTPEDYQVAAIGKDMVTSGQQDLASRQAEETRQQQANAAANKEQETAARPTDTSTHNPLMPDHPNAAEPEVTQQLEARKLAVAKAYEPYSGNSPTRLSLFA